MIRFGLLLVAAGLTAAPPAFAQDDATENDTVVITGQRIKRQDFEAISPVMTVCSADKCWTTDARLGWRERHAWTTSRARPPFSRSASPVRVIRACEISLRLGDEDCAKP